MLTLNIAKLIMSSGFIIILVAGAIQIRLAFAYEKTATAADYITQKQRLYRSPYGRKYRGTEYALSIGMVMVILGSLYVRFA
jgi:hypothetical protein